MLQSDTPTYPHSFAQWAYVALAGFLLYGGGVFTAWVRRKREPAEVAKIQAETRSIDTASDIAAGQLALQAIVKAERVVDERDHWRRKCESLEKQNDLLNIEVNAQDQQMRRMSGFIRAKGLHLSDLDKDKLKD